MILPRTKPILISATQSIPLKIILDFKMDEFVLYGERTIVFDSFVL